MSEEMTRDEKRKARRLAREQARAGRTKSNVADRAKAHQRQAAVVNDTSVTLPLMLGEIKVGKATISETGNIVARISESSIGKAFYPLVKQGIIPALQMGPSFMPEIKSGEYHDENTLFKVRDGLRDVGLNDQQITDAINQMMNHGIVFREPK